MFKTKNRLFLDVRSPEEYLEDFIENSLNIPHDTIMNNLQHLPEDQKILIYCHSGRRSELVAKVLEKLGYDAKNVGTVQRAEDIRLFNK